MKISTKKLKALNFANKSLWLGALGLALLITTVGLNSNQQSPINTQLNFSELKIGQRGIVRGLIVRKQTMPDNPNSKILTLQNESGIQVSVSGSPWQIDELGQVGQRIEITADVSGAGFLSNPKLLKKKDASDSLKNVQIAYEEEAQFFDRGQYVIHVRSNDQLIGLYLSGKLKSRLTLGNSYDIYFSNDTVECVKEISAVEKVCN